MRPHLFGRALGIGVRLAAQRVAPPPPLQPSEAERHRASAARVRRGEQIGRQARAAGKGGKALGRAVWNPFAHAGNILWLETTGMFFALFACFFAQHLWTLRRDWRAGPEHAHFIVYAVFLLIFSWFALSSFARARNRTRRRAEAQRKP